MLKAKKENNLLLTFQALLLLAAYFCLEPLLSQIYILYSYDIFYVPYSACRLLLPLIVFMLFIFRLIKNRGRVHFGVLGPAFAVYLLYVLASALNSENLEFYWLVNLAQVIFIMPVCSNRKIMQNFIRAATLMYTVLAAINVLFILFPNLYSVFGGSYWETFISGWHNMAGFPLIMGMMFALLNCHYNGSRVLLILYTVLFVLNEYLLWSATALVAALPLLLFLSPQVKELVKKLDFSVFIIIILLLFVLLVFVWGSLQDSAVLQFITGDVLKKDVTLTGRVNIWKGIWQMIKEKPLLGHGLSDDPAMYYDPDYNRYWVHAHNLFMQTLYEGGLLTFAAGLSVLFLTAFKLRKGRDREAAAIFKITLFSMLVNYQADQFIVHPWLSGCWAGIFFICNFASEVAENEC